MGGKDPQRRRRCEHSSDVAASIRKKLDEKGLDLKKDVAGAGMGVPGPVMPDGYVEVCVNLGWRDLNPQEELSRLLDGIPVKSGNDANVAALGEMCREAEKATLTWSWSHWNRCWRRRDPGSEDHCRKTWPWR